MFGSRDCPLGCAVGSGIVFIPEFNVLEMGLLLLFQVVLIEILSQQNTNTSVTFAYVQPHVSGVKEKDTNCVKCDLTSTFLQTGSNADIAR